MITMTQMYWLTTLTSIVNLSIVFSILSATAAVFGTILLITAIAERVEELIKPVKLILKISIPTFVVSLMCSVFIPDTKQMAAIYVVPKIVNNEKIQDSANNLVELANEWIEELKPVKKVDK